MANKYKGEISAVLDGGAVTLALTINALCEFEDSTGSTFDKALEAPSLKTIRELVYLSVQNWPDVTREDAGKIIDQNGIGLVERLVEASGLSSEQGPSEGN